MSTQQHSLRLHLLLQLAQPVVDALEALGISEVEHQQRDLSVAVV